MNNIINLKTTTELKRYLHEKFQLSVAKQSDIENFLAHNNLKYVVKNFGVLQSQQAVPPILNTCDCDSVVEFTIELKQRFWLIFTTTLISIIRFYVKDKILEDIKIDVFEKEPL